MRAAEAGRVDTVRLLLQNGADPNVRTAKGETALNLARGHRHVEAEMALLASGALR